MYILVGRGLGDAPSREPWRVRLGLRPKPQYLRFLNLDQFILNKASLTPRLREMVESLAKHVRLQKRLFWKQLAPWPKVRRDRNLTIKLDTSSQETQEDDSRCIYSFPRR